MWANQPGPIPLVPLIQTHPSPKFNQTVTLPLADRLITGQNGANMDLLVNVIHSFFSFYGTISVIRL